MDEQAINDYGDKRIATVSGHGVDIASQRADDLDQFALAYIKERRAEGAVLALEIGCGHGGQAIRMAMAGATVVATDIEDYGQIVADHAASASLSDPDSCKFVRMSIADISHLAGSPQFDIIVCQRMIHYLPYQEAVRALSNLKRVANPRTRLYISASGIDSELGDDYAGKGASLPERFSMLAPSMADKHSIHPPVCLYSAADLDQLLVQTGWHPVSIFVSSFGNIKAIAQSQIS